MAKSIGIRVTPSVVWYCVVDDNNSDIVELITMDRINNPKALNVPEQLKFIRNTLCDIINEFGIVYACIRVTEQTAQSINFVRIHIEGVIQELFASSTIEKYYVGQISNISAHLGIDRSEFKPFAEGRSQFLDFEGWTGLTLENREAFMAAVSALNL